MLPALLLWILCSIASGQITPDFLERFLEYEQLASGSTENHNAEYISIDSDKEKKFLIGLIIEAGRHVVFPELYPPVESNLAQILSNTKEKSENIKHIDKHTRPRFYEISGQPEFEQTYTNRKTRMECPEECKIYKPVCGNDGKVYQSECHLVRENCGSINVTTDFWDKCRGKHYLCPSHCLDISDPVCATDGRIYHNICIMRKINCGKLLQILPLNKCSEDKIYSKDIELCEEVCPELPKPVCGSDGIIYFNECFMRMKTCRQGIVAVDMDSCVETHSCPEICLPFHDPVCGSDGRLYLNHCRMLQGNCGRDVKRMPVSFCYGS